MTSTDRKRLSIGPALRAMAEGAAPLRPDFNRAFALLAARKAARRRARLFLPLAAAAGVCALFLALASRQGAAIPPPGLAELGLDADFRSQSALSCAAQALGMEEGGVEADLLVYIESLWSSAKLGVAEYGAADI